MDIDILDEKMKNLNIKKFQIFIQLLYYENGKYKSSKTIFIDTYEFEYINSIKKKIEDEIQLPIKNQLLIFNGKILSDGTINDYNIKRDNSIHLFSK